MARHGIPAGNDLDGWMTGQKGAISSQKWVILLLLPLLPPRGVKKMLSARKKYWIDVTPITYFLCCQKLSGGTKNIVQVYCSVD